MVMVGGKVCLVLGFVLCWYYPPASKASREVANVIFDKYHTIF